NCSIATRSLSRHRGRRTQVSEIGDDRPYMDAECSRGELLAEADADLARRALPGVWAVIGLVQLLRFPSDFLRGRRIIASIFALVSIVASVLRLFMILRRPVLYPANPRRWGTLF